MNELREGLERLEIEVSSRQESMLNQYIDELMLWNSKLNLVSFRSREELVVRHILDCLSALKVIQQLEGRTIADVGSGAGLPGLLLAIFIEDKHFTLIERSGKKSGFLETVTALLGLAERVDVFGRDLSELDKGFDTVVLRAFRNFGDFYKSIYKITNTGGAIAAYKGRSEQIRADLADAKLNEEDVMTVELEVPFLEEQRNLLVIKK